MLLIIIEVRRLSNPLAAFASLSFSDSVYFSFISAVFYLINLAASKAEGFH
jgi:hypothetical protein